MTFIICCHFTMTNSKPLLRASESKVFPTKQKSLMFEKSDTVANCFWKASMAFETRLFTRKSTNPMWTKNWLSVDSQLKGKPKISPTLHDLVALHRLHRNQQSERSFCFTKIHQKKTHTSILEVFCSP